MTTAETPYTAPTNDADAISFALTHLDGHEFKPFLEDYRTGGPALDFWIDVLTEDAQFAEWAEEDRASSTH